MKTILFVCIAFLSSLSFASAKDFFKTEVGPGFRKNGVRTDTDCRAHIRKVICLVDPVKDLDNVKPETRACLAGGLDYAHIFENIYDAVPPTLQKMFCSLDFLFIEKEFAGTAYAGALTDDTGKLVGAQMGFNQRILDKKMTLEQWASWKEQLSFGGDAKNFNVDSALPEVLTRTAIPVSDFIYFVLVHEFGHLFDFANDLNKKENCTKLANGDEECVMSAGSWGALSWETSHKPRTENEFLNRSGLCFYWCGDKPLSPSTANQIYEDIYETSFLSLYASQQPWDDFADSLAYYLMSKELETVYINDPKTGLRYNVMTKIELPVFAAKKKYIEGFLNNPAIVYP